MISLPHCFVDWPLFLSSGESDLHNLVLSTSHRGGWDHCCRRAVWDRADAPYPLRALGGHYLDAIVKQQVGRELPPRLTRHHDLYERQSPYYFAGVTKGDLAVVDLERAYWQLYRPASLDLDYDGEREPRNGSIRFLGSDELGEHKELYQAIAGMWVSRRRLWMDHGALRVEQPIVTKRQRPDLWGYLQDMLEAIAWDMRRLFGAVHVMIDGYVLPHADLAEDAVQFLSDRWGLSASVRARGEGIVNGLNNWVVGARTVGEHDLKWQEGFPEPVEYLHGSAQRIDNMVERRKPDLCEWFRDALAYFRENRVFYPKGVDGPPLVW